MTDAITDKYRLKLEHFNLWIGRGKQEVQILRDLNLKVNQGERWGIVGESGAGKSMTMHAITGLLPRKSIRTEGSIERPTEQIALILQDSIHALNPYWTIEKQWKETLLLYQPSLSAIECRDYLIRRLEHFGIRDGEEVLRKYPHQLSGGMKQRIAIGMALESRTDFLIADEPTTSLDAINQRRVIDFIREICDREQLTLLYISHNLGIIQNLCTHMAVMKDGEFVEQGETEKIFREPKHPYAAELIRQTAGLYRGGWTDVRQ